MVEKVTLSELKGIAPQLKEEQTQGKNHQVMPMFLPTDISGKKGRGTIQVVTRQKFMDEGIQNWIYYHSFRAAAGALAIVAIMLFAVNPILSAVAAIGAGYAYGQYKWKDFIVNKLMKMRWLLEGT